ncbi:MAG TPA: hypothetical protein PK954_26655 [Anaerolineales bacterium]|nr:hypothetical protein [Anaerolineales bacterium]
MSTIQVLSEWLAALGRRLKTRLTTGDSVGPYQSSEPADPGPAGNWMLQALKLNRGRRAVNHAEAAQAGAAYLVECRDLWDAHDTDAGVYFVPCATEAEVTALVNQHNETDPNDRILGIYRVDAPIEPQGPGLTREAWLAGGR